MIRALGHVGVYAGLYVASAMVCLFQLAGLGAGGSPLPRWDAMLSVVLIAIGAYALDRVKLRDAWIDPADLEAQPERYAFLVPRARLVRGVALALIAAGSLLGMRISAAAPLAGGLSLAGVALYAAGPKRSVPRIKDHLALKNVYVGAGITGFVALAALGASAPGGSWKDLFQAGAMRSAAVGSACVLVFLRVTLDASICDLDDEASDRRHGTATLPTAIGGLRAWTATGIARVLVIAGTLACPWCPWPARLAWTAVGLAGMLALRMLRPVRVRDAVDIRLTVEAACASVALAFSPGFLG